MARLFGTDGVRGIANGPVLSAELALALGRAAVAFARERGAVQPEIVIGRDTRRSGPLLEDAFCAGVASAGGVALRAGVLPTPAVALLVREQTASLGAVISASHNPFPDNGIKFFGPDGFKLLDADEDRIEALLGAADELPTGAGIGDSRRLADAPERYVDWIVAQAFAMPRMRVLVDCAHGAAATVAPSLFASLGVEHELIGCAPDGVNINAGVGSTHLGALAEGVRSGGFDLGIAFDGDADRMLAVDAEGRDVDGDQIIALLARDLQATGRLKNDTVVVTSMSNLGLHRALAALGITAIVTDVGDRYVLEAMLEHDAVLGGEQSGHVIALDRQTTGDGVVSAVLLLDALARAGETLSAAASLVTRFPQKLVNVRADRSRLEGNRAIWDVVDAENAALARSGAGRILLRPSGTESLVRVMVEHEIEGEVERLCGSITALVERELGQA